VSVVSEYPRWKIELRHEDGPRPQSTRAGRWYADLYRQEKKYAKWVLTSTGQGKSLSIALGACGARTQEITKVTDPADPTKTILKYPELTS